MDANSSNSKRINYMYINSGVPVIIFNYGSNQKRPKSLCVLLVERSTAFCMWKLRFDSFINFKNSNQLTVARLTLLKLNNSNNSNANNNSANNNSNNNNNTHASQNTLSSMLSSSSGNSFNYPTSPIAASSLSYQNEYFEK
jgi:hypothetical protein